MKTEAIERGLLLLDAKQFIGHGYWGRFLRETVHISPQTAARYMRLARAYTKTTRKQHSHE